MKVKNHFHEEIELKRMAAEGIYICEACNGTGCVDTPFSGDDPSCEACSGEGLVYGEPA